MDKLNLNISGMHCNSCAMLIEKSLQDKVHKVSASYANESVKIEFDENKISEKEIIQIIEKLGYKVVSLNSEKEQTSVGESKFNMIAKDISELKSESRVIRSVEEEIEEKEEEIVKKLDSLKNSSSLSAGTEPTSYGWIAALLGGLFLLFIVYYFFFSNFSLPDIQVPQLGDKTSLILLFVAGLLTGFHCIAMCGGFVVSYTGKNAIKGHKGFKQHLVYGGSKVLSYTIIGGIFGLVGGIFAFSVGLRGWVAILAGIFMIAYSLSMLGIRFFRKFQFNPKFLSRFASKESGKFSGVYSRPLVTGLLNGLFIACGPLQAMYLYAAGTGNFFSGASSLFAFGLGTLPVMLGFGSLATVISHGTTKKILKIAAVLVLILGLVMLNRGLTLTGSQWNYDGIKSKFVGGQAGLNIGAGSSNVIIKDNLQEVNMQVDASGYSPNSFVIKKGLPVKWNVQVTQLTGCNSELVSNEYGVNARLKQGLNVFEFTPDKEGTFSFSCGMGMLRGSFIVTKTGTATTNQISAAAVSNYGGSCGMGGGGGGCGCGG